MLLSVKAARAIFWRWHRAVHVVVVHAGFPVSTKKTTENFSINYEQNFAGFSTTGTMPTSVEDSRHTGIEVVEDKLVNMSVEAVVGKFEDMKDGEMKTVAVDQGKALLVREEGQYYAVGHKCTHYGAPLHTGSLCNGRVRCPWHGACFNIKTGDIEDFPGLDSLPKFEVEIRGSDVVVKADPEQFKSHKRVKKMSKANPTADKRTFVIIGGGGSAVKAAEALREEGFQGRIIMASRELHVPYDRPRLSKQLAASPDDLKVRSVDYLNEHGIEFLGGKEAVGLDKGKKTVSFSDGTSLNYDTVLLATGGKPRSLNYPGTNLENILLLRSPEDANKIAAQAKGMNAVVIGSSFIGMEVAAYLADKATSVTVIGRSAIPFANVLGKEIGTLLKKMHEDKGVKFITGVNVKEFKGTGGKLNTVALEDGTELDADICILGVGVSPSTAYLKESGVPLTPQGTVIVDKHMQACEGVFAAGDIATFPLKMLNWENVNIGHWQMAAKHGLTAARNMLGRKEEINTVPFFWTMQFGKSIRYAGHAHNFDDIIIDGSVEEKKFIAYYVKGDNIVAVATMGRDPVAARAANWFFEGKMLAASAMRSDPQKWLNEPISS